MPTFFMNVASFTARSKKDNSRYSAERNNLASPPVCERTDFIAYFIRIFQFVMYLKLLLKVGL